MHTKETHMEDKKSTEEVTITPVIRDIEKLINKLVYLLFSLFGGIVKGVQSFFLYALRKYKLIIVLAIVGFGFGLASFMVVPTKYASNLVLQLNIDARAQLFSDIVYFNSLVQRQKTDKLMELFNLSEEEAKSITKFEIRPFSTVTERIEYVDRVYRNLDTSYQKLINLEEIVDENDYSYSNKFLIVIISTDEFIFEKMEEPLLAFLERVPELNKMRQESLAILMMKKEKLEKEIAGLDTLKKISNNVLIEQAKSKSRSNSGTSINLGQSSESNLVNPLEIFSKVAEYNNQVINIQQQLDSFSHCYKVFSHINPVGFKNSLGKTTRSLIFSISFVLVGMAISGISDALKK